eukprot:6485537-Amphidinium_carterae.6
MVYEFALGHVHVDYRVACLPVGTGDGYTSQVLNIRRTVDVVLGGEVVFPAASGHEKSPQGTFVVRATQKDDLCDPKSIRELARAMQYWVYLALNHTTLEARPSTPEKRKVEYDECLESNALTLVRCQAGCMLGVAQVQRVVEDRRVGQAGKTWPAGL